MVILKKLVTTLTCFALLISISSCSKVDPKEIVNAADVYARSVQNLDAERLINLTKKMDDKAANDLRDHLNLSKLKKDDALVKRTIAETISYTIDESSVKVNGKTATCIVKFSIVNIDNRPKKLVDNAEAFVQIIKELKETDTFEITLAFEKVDGQWLASADNLDLFDDLYSFLDSIFEFVPLTESKST